MNNSQINESIAIKVMNWITEERISNTTPSKKYTVWHARNSDRPVYSVQPHSVFPYWNPVHDLNQAWDVVKRALMNAEHTIDLQCDSTGNARASLRSKEGEVIAWWGEMSPAKALCMAALELKKDAVD